MLGLLWVLGRIRTRVVVRVAVRSNGFVRVCTVHSRGGGEEEGPRASSCSTPYLFPSGHTALGSTARPTGQSGGVEGARVWPRKNGGQMDGEMEGRMPVHGLLAGWDPHNREV